MVRRPSSWSNLQIKCTAHQSHVVFSLKTSWLKWNPDHAGAAHAFDKAGMPWYLHLLPCILVLHMTHTHTPHVKQPFVGL